MMNSQTYLRGLLVVLCLVTNMQTTSIWAGESVPDYDKQVAPLFRKYCGGCHNGTELEGEFNLETYAELQKGGPHGPAVLPGDAKSSRLFRMMSGQLKPQMPPKDNPAPSSEELAILRAWIDGGAVGPAGAVPGTMKLVTPKIAPSAKPKGITAVAWSPDATLMAVAKFGEVQLCKADTQEVVGRIPDLPGKVTSVKFTANGKYLLVASGVAGLMGQATLWSISDNQPVRQFQGHRDLLYSAVISGDGKTIATAGYDRQIILWNAETGDQLRTLKGHNDAIYDLAFNQTGTVLASASGDQTIKLWQASTGVRLDTLSQPLKEQYCVTFSPDGKFVVAGGVDNRIRVWKLMSDSVPQINPILFSRFAHEGPLVQIAFSTDGKKLVSVSEDRTVKLWNAETWDELHVYGRQPEIPAALAWSPAGSHFALGRLDGSLEILPVIMDADVPASIPVVASDATSHGESPLVSAIETEPNDNASSASAVTLPVTVTGVIHSERKEQPADVDYYRFESKGGQTWVFEVNASRDKSPLDSKIEILTDNGLPILRTQLQAVRDSYVTFRGIDSNTRDCRVHNWQEMKLNEFLYIGGEVVKLYLAPRGPDSGFAFYPHEGTRRGYFDTTPTSHAVNEPCYSVVPHPPGATLIPNGLPVFPLYYENDDDGLRKWGADSRLTFTAPADGKYLVRVSDVRGFQGPEYKYALTIRPARPGFELTIQGANPTIGLGSGKEFAIVANRVDGFDGEIRVDIKNVPPGFGITSPLVIASGHDIARGTINSLPTATAPSDEQNKAIEFLATATVDGQIITKPILSFGAIKLAEKPKILVEVLPMDAVPPVKSNSPDSVPTPYEITIAPGQTITARVRIQRNGYDGRVQFEAINQNLPHGVIIDNIGLNGLMIVDGQTERVFFLTAADWVPEQSRSFHLKSQEEGNQTSWAVILHVKRPGNP